MCGSLPLRRLLGHPCGGCAALRRIRAHGRFIKIGNGSSLTRCVRRAGGRLSLLPDRRMHAHIVAVTAFTRHGRRRLLGSRLGLGLCGPWVEAGGIGFGNIFLAYGVGIKFRLRPLRRADKPPRRRRFACGGNVGILSGRRLRLVGRKRSSAVFAVFEVILIVCAAYLAFHIEKTSCTGIINLL